MAVLYELLAVGRAARASRRWPRMSVRAAVSRGRAARRDLLIRGAHVLDPRAGLDGPTTCSIRDGEIAELGAPGRSPRPTSAEVVDGDGQARCSRPSSTRTSTCARPARSTRRTSTTGTAAAAAGGYCAVVAMPNTDPDRRHARRCCGVAARARRSARRACRSASSPRSRAGSAATELTEMAELRDAGALGFTDDGKPVVSAGMLRQALQYQRLCGGVARAARGGPGAVGRRRDARGRGLGAARAGRDPVGLGVDDGRARQRARRLRGRAGALPAPVARSSPSQALAAGQGGGARVSGEACAAPPRRSPTRRSARSTAASR